MDESRDLFMATLAKHLSTAYHIQWHESKLNDMQNRMSTAKDSDRSKGYTSRHISLDMLGLVRHKNSDRLVVQVIDSIQKNLSLKRIAFLYQPRNSVKAALIVRGENRASLKIPSIESVDFADNLFVQNMLLLLEEFQKIYKLPLQFLKRTLDFSYLHKGYKNLELYQSETSIHLETFLHVPE